jgi:superfamily I DNA and/or RNA helicase
MASLSSVYVATSHADRAVVLIGDPQQLSPIANADTHLARKWLKKDLFEFRGIYLDVAMQGYLHSMMLDVQSRMHPMISAVANRLVYQNRLKDAHNISQLQNIEPLPASPLVLCDTHDASPIAMRPPSGTSRKNYYHALCCLAIARQALKSFPTKTYTSGPYIGIVTPYKPQAQLLQSLIADAGLQNLLQAGTVHKFQGLEFEIVIFDTVESPGVKPWCTGSEGSPSMRLVNVAITRAKQKLILVANYKYILQEVPESATMRLAVEAAANSARLSSLDIINFASISSEDPTAFPNTRNNTFHSLNTAIDTKASGGDYIDIKHLTDEKFYDSLHQDIQDAHSSIVIASAFAASNRLNKLLPRLVEKQRNGIKVKIFSRGDGDGWHIKGVKTIRESGIEIVNREKMHEKIIVIDERILYHGSLNALSQNDTTESMLRIINHRIVQEVSEYIQSERLCESKQSNRLNIDQKILETLEKITLSVKKLPPCPGVCKCGGSFVQRYSAKNGSAFYGCSLFFSLPSMEHTIKNLSLSFLEEIPELQGQLCTVCGNSMSLDLQYWPLQQRILLICNNISCGRMKRVVFTR